jgi:hypothetical protein
VTATQARAGRNNGAQPERADRPPIAWRSLGAIGGSVAVVLVAASGRYGYHRDELYFLQAGQHLSFGYVDQPPLTPVLARVATELFGDSLVGLRLVSALAAGAAVLLTGLIAREFGGGRGAQALAAGCLAVSAFLLAVGHLLSTSTFDLLAWTALSWLVVRALRDGGPVWAAVGVVAGIGLQNKTLMAFLLVGLAVGVLVAGPRRRLRGRWPWLAAVIAVVVWTPALVWQARHGWPQLELSEAIAAGSSGTSEPRELFLPMQLVLISPMLVPVWVAGLWRLARSPALRAYRSFAVAYLVLAAVFLVTGGKPYYLAGLYPVLLAAGAEPTLRWCRAGASRLRPVLLGASVALSALVAGVLMLPVVPVGSLGETPIVDINYDAGETVGWPGLVRTVAGVHRSLSPAEKDKTTIVARNYGQAGAVDRFGPELALPRAYSGHNSYALWGPPPENATIAIVIGYDQATLRSWFGSIEEVALVDNGVDLDNDEQGTPIWLCRNRLAAWSQIWPDMRRLG